MNFRTLLYFLLIFIGSSLGSDCIAQTSAQELAEARRRSIDSARDARTRELEIIKATRQKRADSLARIRKYKESKQYKDSVADARQERLDSIKAVRTAFFDSVKAERKKITDSTVAVRTKRLDSVKAVLKMKANARAKLKKYKESKRYRDSVVVVKKQRLDSMKAERKLIADFRKAERQAKLDSMNEARVAAGLAPMGGGAAGPRNADSLQAARKARTDSLAKNKEKRAQKQKNLAKAKEDRMKMAFELKLKKKREAWSNEKMLKKKWGVGRQIVQNTFTRYNYYFNTDRKMDEALENMLRAKKENLDSLLALFPFNPDRDSATLSADMDSIIQKASVGIQIHDPRTKWGDDLYLLMGQAYYYKGNYENANTTFRYIVSLRDKGKKKTEIAKRRKGTSIAQAENKNMFDFLKHRSVHNESILWLSRTYTQTGNVGAAESVLDLLETDPNFPESMKGRMAVERAFINLAERDYNAATKNLAIVSTDNNLPDWIRMRAGYLNGQLLMEQGNYAASKQSFENVLDLHPKIDMDFYSRKNIAYSSMLAGGSQEDAVASLKKVLNDGKYIAYHEQVYYVMGKLAANSGDSKNAIEYLSKSLESPKSTKKQKALSYAALGDLHYKAGDYFAAKNAYDSVAALAAAVPDDSGITVAVKRSMALSTVTKPLSIIHEQDSLLALAAMSERDQKQAARRQIRMLEDKKADSAFRAENAGVNAALQNMAVDVDDMGNVGSGAPKWYFANPTLMQQGYNEFKRKWGNRQLTDNWRRSSGGAGMNNNNIADNSGSGQVFDTSRADGRVVEYDAQGIPTEASLLSFIPRSTQDKDNALKQIRRAHMDLANAYVNDLEDYPPGIRTLDTMDKRFPAHEYQAEALYTRYIVALRKNDLKAAQGYTEQLLRDHPDSKFTAMVRPTEDGKGLTDMNIPVEQYYEETYALMEQKQYSDVLVRAKDGQRRYPHQRYIKRFIIMEGIGLAGTTQYDKADSLLSNFIIGNPTDSLRPWADALIQYIRANRPPPPPVDTNIKINSLAAPAITDSAGNVISSPGATSTGNAPTAGTVPPLPGSSLLQSPADLPVSMAPPPPAEYEYKPSDPHYVIIRLNVADQRATGLKAGVSDFNTFKFGALNLTTDMGALPSQQGIVITKSFKAVGQAKIYMNSLSSTTQIFRDYKPTEYSILMISEPNFRKLGADRDIDAYLKFYEKNYK